MGNVVMKEPSANAFGGGIKSIDEGPAKAEKPEDLQACTLMRH